MSFLSAIGGGGVDASGGTTVTTFTDNTGTEYRVHAFENVGSDTFTVNSGGEVDVLVVGGGGGGNDTQNNNRDRGGGGAGGLVFANETVTVGQYNIVVGDGGVDENNGENSTALGLTALGGGIGSDFVDGTDGGSGGGGGNGGLGGAALQPGTNPNAMIDAGFEGGDGKESPAVNGSDPNAGAGGGGAGERGGDGGGGSSAIAGGGGDGLDFSQEFGTTFGENGYFAGGGGGSAEDGGGIGGLGGGGQGRTSSTVGSGGVDGTGGGAGSQNPSEGGGSGIVIIRYEI
jgi:hypothetical protein